MAKNTIERLLGSGARRGLRAAQYAALLTAIASTVAAQTTDARLTLISGKAANEIQLTPSERIGGSLTMPELFAFAHQDTSLARWSAIPSLPRGDVDLRSSTTWMNPQDARLQDFFLGRFGALLDSPAAFSQAVTLEWMRAPERYRRPHVLGLPRMDTAAVGLRWSPTEHLWLHAKWSQIESPVPFEPELLEREWALGGAYARSLSQGRWWSVALAVARSDRNGLTRLDAATFEIAATPRPLWTVFGRVEMLKLNELRRIPDSPTRNFGRFSFGAMREFYPSDSIHLGVGLSYTHDWAPISLNRPFRGDPHAVMAFVLVAVD